MIKYLATSILIHFSILFAMQFIGFSSAPKVKISVISSKIQWKAQLVSNVKKNFPKQSWKTKPTSPKDPDQNQKTLSSVKHQKTESNIDLQKLVKGFVLPSFEYPNECLRQASEGRVLVRATISSSGLVIRTELLQSADCEAFNQEALRVVKEGRLNLPPELQTSSPIILNIPITFRMESDD